MQPERCRDASHLRFPLPVTPTITKSPGKAKPASARRNAGTLGRATEWVPGPVLRGYTLPSDATDPPHPAEISAKPKWHK